MKLKDAPFVALAIVVIATTLGQTIYSWIRARIDRAIARRNAPQIQYRGRSYK